MNQADEILGRDAPALSVGPLRLQGRALLAPMAGVTDLGMRRIAEQFGAALTVSEMLDAAFFTSGDAMAVSRAAGSGITLHVVQIAGCAAAMLAEAARRAEGAGAAMIDINMGCPAKRVTGGLAGSALMRDLDLAVDLIRSVVGAVRIPVSLKMRLGWDDATANAPELARRAEAEGIAMLTVHGRTRCQFYNGTADWRAIRKVREATSLPLVANGDCKSCEDAAAMLAESGADAVMIGRGSIGRPWFVGEVARYLANRAPFQPSIAQRTAAVLEHYRTLLGLFGKAQGLRHARKHLAGYVLWSGRPDAMELRRRIVTIDDTREVETILAGLYDVEGSAVAA